MALFKKKKMIAFAAEDRKLFEDAAAERDIKFKVKLADDGFYEYTFDEDRWPDIEFLFMPSSESHEQEEVIEEELPLEPEEPPKKRKTELSTQIGTATDKSLAQAGIYVPPVLETKSAEQPSEIRSEAEQETAAAGEEPPSDLENRWAENVLAEEIKEIEEEIKQNEAIMENKEPAPSEEPSKPKRKRKSMGRVNQIKTRLTDSELVQFQRRLQKSGMSQGDFIRQAVLTGQVTVREIDPTLIALLDEMERVRAELGRQGGMLKMLIRPNEGQRTLNPEEWDKLIAVIRYMEKTKDMIASLEVKVNGHHNSSNK